MTAMISQPMNGVSESKIVDTKSKAITVLESMGYSVINTYWKDDYYEMEEGILKKDEVKNIPLYFVARALNAMSRCDAIYFCKGWESARGCKVEHRAAIEYGLKCIYEV